MGIMDVLLFIDIFYFALVLRCYNLDAFNAWHFLLDENRTKKPIKKRGAFMNYRMLIQIIFNVMVSLFTAWFISTLNPFPEMPTKIVFMTVFIIGLATCTLLTSWFSNEKKEEVLS